MASRALFLFLFIFVFAGCASPSAHTRKSGRNLRSKNPTLFVQVDGHKSSWTRSELLHLPGVERVKLPKDPTYGARVKSFVAIRAANLIKKVVAAKTLAQLVRDNAQLEFKCLDGFSANLSLKRILNENQRRAIAYIAIELPNKKWPKLKTGRTAGPYYLIWQHADRSHIGPEEWPYQLRGFVVKTPVNLRFPKIVPGTKNKKVLVGFRLFKQNCFMCHTMNGEGESRLGPDLNLPLNPTQYFRAGMIRRLIRDPQNLRHWPESKMSSFPPSVLSDEQITDIIDYLRFMARHKSNWPVRGHKSK